MSKREAASIISTEEISSSKKISIDGEEKQKVSF
jgi:hypothetical protein